MLLKLREDNSEFLLRDRRCVMFFYDMRGSREGGGGGGSGPPPLEFAKLNIADISGN